MSVWIGIGLIVLEAWLASARVDVFATNLTLWTDAARLAHPSPRTLLNAAAYLGRAGRMAEACDTIRRAREAVEAATDLTEIERAHAYLPGLILGERACR